MSERENQWTKALAENGSFDPEKAKRANETVVAHYLSGLKKVERVLWVYLIVCVAVAVFCMNEFLWASSFKAMIGCGIVFLVAIESTILIKLWYWIVNTKLSLQKEIRQSQLQGAMPESAAYAPSWFWIEMSFGRPGLSPWERRAWLAGLILVAIASSSYVSSSKVMAPNPLTLSDSIKLAPDGTSSSTMDVSYQPKAGLSVDSVPFYTGCLKGKSRWLDERGRLLPYDVTTQGGQRCYTVHLIEPIGFGEWLRYTQIRDIPSAATHEGDLWTYQNDYTYGCSSNRYFVTIELPPRAKVVSVDPQPIEQSTDNGAPNLVFSVARGNNERFEYKIRYRLAREESLKKPTSRK